MHRQFRGRKAASPKTGRKWKHTTLVLIETPFKVNSSGLCRRGKLLLWSHCPLHNQDSSLWQPSRYIYLLRQQTLHTYRQTCRHNWILTKALSYTNMFGTWPHIFPTRRLNMNTSTCKHRVQHNFRTDKNTTLLLWSSLHNIPRTRGVYGPTRGWQRSVVTPLSLTGSVFNHNHTVTTRRPGARWACHYAGHNTNISPVLSLYICARGASSGAWAVKVYFWMYSLHSERVAVGARQLWRQRVIVARQADRPKMAELTGTRRSRRGLHLHSLASGKL